MDATGAHLITSCREDGIVFCKLSKALTAEDVKRVWRAKCAARNIDDAALFTGVLVREGVYSPEEGAVEIERLITKIRQIYARQQGAAMQA